jgi:hypothetical protein
MDPISEVKSCVAPCKSDDDCAVLGVVCDSGSCAKSPPQIRLDQPADDLSLSSATDTGPITGTVSFWGESARLRAGVRQVATPDSCFTGVWDFPWVKTITNSYPEDYAEESFSLSPLPVRPGDSNLTVSVGAGGKSASVIRHINAPPCTDCPGITITSPASGSTLDPSTLVLPNLEGTVSLPNATCARWSLTSQGGETAGGLLQVTQGRFGPYPLPVFAGTNRLRVEAGSLSTGSCEITVNAYERATVALRTQLVWDTTGDMDLHLVRPGGTYWTATDCYYANCRGGLTWGASSVYLDVDNVTAFGPENIRLNVLEGGTYGILVNPYSGASTVTVRVYAGNALVGSVGPCRLTGTSDLVVGTYGPNGFEPLNLLVLKRDITTSPESWGSGNDPFGSGVSFSSCPPAVESTCADNP